MLKGRLPRKSGVSKSGVGSDTASSARSRQDGETARTRCRRLRRPSPCHPRPPSSAAPARTTARTPAPPWSRCAMAARSASTAIPIIPSPGAGSAPRCVPIWTASTLPTGCNIRCAASGAKGSGEWARITWDDAIGEIAERWQAIIAEHGAAAILPYSFSGTLGLLQGGVASIRLWNRMGVSGLERSICGAAAETAVKMTLGGRLAPDARDVRHSELIVIWGHNPASTVAPLHALPARRAARRRLRRRHRSPAHDDRALGRRAPAAAPGHRRRAGPRTDARPLR